MTVTVKVHVNGNYRCKVKQQGRDAEWVGPNEERLFHVAHSPRVDEFFHVGPEEYLGEPAKPAPVDAA